MLENYVTVTIMNVIHTFFSSPFSDQTTTLQVCYILCVINVTPTVNSLSKKSIPSVTTFHCLIDVFVSILFVQNLKEIQIKLALIYYVYIYSVKNH